MPIVRTYGDAGVFGQGSHDAGFALGRSQRLQQQRQIDANFIADRLAAREELTRIRALEDLERSRSRQSGGGGGSRGPSRSDIQDIIEGYERDQKDKQTIESVAERKRVARETESAGLLASLDAAYKDKDKDLTYEYAREQFMNGKTIPETLLKEIGIVSPTRTKADETDIESGFQPKSSQERLFRRSIEQGNLGDIAAYLDQQESTNKYGGPNDDDPLSMDALAARTQLDAVVSTISDRAQLREYRDELKKAGVSDEAVRMIDERDAELADTEMKVKAPAAFESIVSAFGPKLQAMQDKEGRALNMGEKRKLLSGIISTTATSYGLTVDQIGQYIRENDETRRMSEMLIQKAQDAIMENMQSQIPTGAQQEFGGEPLPSQSQIRRQRRPDRAVDQGG